MKKLLYLFAGLIIAYTASGQATINQSQTINGNVTVTKQLQVTGAGDSLKIISQGDSCKVTATNRISVNNAIAINSSLIIRSGAAPGEYLRVGSNGVITPTPLGIADTVSASNGITETNAAFKLGGTLSDTVTRLIANGKQLIVIDTANKISFGIGRGSDGTTPIAFIQYIDDSTRYLINVNQYGAFVTHYNIDTNGTQKNDGSLNVVHYKNTLNRKREDTTSQGVLLAISNTNDYNTMSITDSVGEVSKFENYDTLATILAGRYNAVKLNATTLRGIYSDVEKWRIDNAGAAYFLAQKVGTAGAIDSKAVLDIASTTKGALLPRMTTTQRNAISSPTEGLEVYDTTLHKKCYYNGSVWKVLATE